MEQSAARVAKLWQILLSALLFSSKESPVLTVSICKASEKHKHILKA